MMISKIIFEVKNCGVENLRNQIENFGALFKNSRGCKEISIYQTDNDEVTSFAIYEDQESANNAIQKLIGLFQAVESKLKNLPEREFISPEGFKILSEGQRIFHFNSPVYTCA